MLVSSLFILGPIISNEASYVRWRNTIHYPQHLPGKGCQTLRQTVIDPRRTTLLRLHRECPSPYWVILVWMVVFSFNSLDRSYNCHYLCHDGDLLHLSCCLQLPCRHISSLRKLGFSSPIILSKHARGCLSIGDNSNVQSHDFCWGFELSWKRGGIAYCRALGSGILRT